MGARGGAGSSTFALALARHFRNQGERVNLVDSDPWVDMASDSAELMSADPTLSIVTIARNEEIPDVDRIVLVVPSELKAITTALLLLPELERKALVSLVVRTPGPTPITPKKIAQLLQIDLAAVIKEDPKIALLGEHGSPTTRQLTQSVEALAEAITPL